MIEDPQICHFIYFTRRASGIIITKDDDSDKFVKSEVIGLFVSKLWRKFVNPTKEPDASTIAKIVEAIHSKASGGSYEFLPEKENEDSQSKWAYLELRIYGDTLLVFISYIYAGKYPDDVFREMMAFSPKDISTKYSERLIGQSVCVMSKRCPISIEDYPTSEQSEDESICKKAFDYIVSKNYSDFPVFSLVKNRIFAGTMYQDDPLEKYEYLLNNHYDISYPTFTYLFYDDDDNASTFLQRMVDIEWYHCKIKHYLIDYARFSENQLKKQKQKLSIYLDEIKSLGKKNKLSIAEKHLQELSNELTKFTEAIYFIKQLRESLEINIINIERYLAFKLSDGKDFFVSEEENRIYRHIQNIAKTKMEQMDYDISYLEKDCSVFEIERNKLDTTINLIRAQQERKISKWFIIIGTALAVGEVVMNIDFINPTSEILFGYGIKFLIIITGGLIALLIYRLFEDK